MLKPIRFQSVRRNEVGAKISAASRIIAVDVIREKLELAGRAGATDVVDASQSDPVEAVLELTAGRGVDYAIEAIGRARTIEQAYQTLAPGGVAVVAGQVPTGVTIEVDPMAMSGRELTLTGSNYGSVRPSVDFRRILGFHDSGVIDLNLLVDGRVPLESINHAFDTLPCNIVNFRRTAQYFIARSDNRLCQWVRIQCF